MELITKILDGFDLAKIIPTLDVFLGTLQTLAVLAALIGPIVMLINGALYLWKPVPEANHKAGFRTYFGMGSVKAWQFTQRLAGRVWFAVGAVLTVVSAVVCLIAGGKDPMGTVQTVAVILIIQAIAAFVCWLAITIVVTITFDKDGKRRS